MSQGIHIRLAEERPNTSVGVNRAVPKIYTPGEIITVQKDFMRGHGTYEEDGYLKASVAGVKEQIHKLITIQPLKSRYNGEIGDVVIGRVTEVQSKRWKVDTNSRLDSVLPLQCVNLPGGELRRRSTEDERAMRKYLKEGDLISAEVQNIYSDGALSLHVRSAKYGKLGQGVFVKVFPSLIKKTKSYIHNLPVGATVILGSNGFIWISELQTYEHSSSATFVQNLEKEVSRLDRETIARLRNCILALAHCKMMLYDTSILYAFEESLKYTVGDLIIPEAIVDVALLTQHRLNLLNEG